MAAQRSANRPPNNSFLPLILVGIFACLALSLWGAVSFARALDDQPVIANPMAVVFGLLIGTVPWPGVWAVVFLVVEVLLLASLVVGAVLVVRRRRRGRTRVDDAARHLAVDRDLEPYTPAGAARSAARLRPRGAGDEMSGWGLFIGKIKRTLTAFLASWEDMIVIIAGPRVGKSTSQAIPMIVAAPGPVIATSNKRDLHDATRLSRSQRGQVWVFDPQDIIGAEPEFWFDPLAGITGPTEADVLVSHFVAVSGADAKRDAYFDPEGEALLSYLLLAAAQNDRPITDAYKWAVNSNNREPITLLGTENDLIARKLQMLYELPDKQREGVFSTAAKLMRCLEDPKILRWVVRPRRLGVRRFDPHAFVRSCDTLYLLSKEGGRTASPLVAALTQAVLDAGEALAKRSAGARLDPPLVGILDEAANVCRIKELPALYSHYGSRGMVLVTILQSWEQGAEAWGDRGMTKLWSSANVRVYLGGEADEKLLNKIAQLIGDHYKVVYSETRDRSGHSSRTGSPQPQLIFKVSDLAAFPRGRAIVLASGVPATLLETVPWMAGAHAQEIQRSLERYDPAFREHPIDPVLATPLEEAGGA